MPQITVDYSDRLADTFDRTGFALALHPTVAKIAGAKFERCMTVFRRTEGPVVAESADSHTSLHITIGLIPGRTDETKARLTSAALELVKSFIASDDGRTLLASAEVRDLFVPVPLAVS